MGVLILALIINANVLAVIQDDELRARDGNRRQLIDEYAQQRGSILVGRKRHREVGADRRATASTSAPTAMARAVRTGHWLLLALRRHRRREGRERPACRGPTTDSLSTDSPNSSPGNNPRAATSC